MMGLRYSRGLIGMWRRGFDPEAADRAVRQALANRASAFLHILKRGVFDCEASPYRPLLVAAGVELGDVVRLVESEGVEGTLARLHAAGVWVSLDEFKGRRPLVRPNVQRELSAADFDNPLVTSHFEASTGGSGGSPRRVAFDLDQIELECGAEFRLFEHIGVVGRPAAMWRPVPPGAAGLRVAIRSAHRGQALSRWFSQQPVTFTNGALRDGALTMLSVGLGAVGARTIPWPIYVPLDQAWKVAEWLADMRASGRAGFLDTNAASGVRVCQTALERGLDIGDSVFRIGGEPYTPGKARVFTEAGCTAFAHYAMTEAGLIGLACGVPAELDEVHVMDDKIAMIDRPVVVGQSGVSVNALFLTSLLPSSQKLMLNVESGDYGVSTHRQCGCPLEHLGFRRHLHRIRSYEKLSSEGMHFIGDDLLAIVDELLPARFGGSSTDYQFVEREDSGLPRVALIVSPRLGEIDEHEIVRAVLDALGSGGGARAMMARRWEEGHTLRIDRREPFSTAAAKILSLHFDKH